MQTMNEALTLVITNHRLQGRAVRVQAERKGKTMAAPIPSASLSSPTKGRKTRGQLTHLVPHLVPV